MDSVGPVPQKSVPVRFQVFESDFRFGSGSYLTFETRFSVTRRVNNETKPRASDPKKLCLPNPKSVSTPLDETPFLTYAY